MNRYTVFLTNGKTIEIEAEQVWYSEKTNCITFRNVTDDTIARFALENIAGYAKAEHTT